MAPPVLIVEDDAAIGEGLLAALGSAGFDAVWGRSGAEALAEVDRARPDLVLLDLGLPDMDGVLCRELRRSAPGAVIAVLTARTAEFDVIVAPGGMVAQAAWV